MPRTNRSACHSDQCRCLGVGDRPSTRPVRIAGRSHLHIGCSWRSPGACTPRSDVNINAGVTGSSAWRETRRPVEVAVKGAASPGVQISGDVALSSAPRAGTRSSTSGTTLRPGELRPREAQVQPLQAESGPTACALPSDDGHVREDQRAETRREDLSARQVWSGARVAKRGGGPDLRAGNDRDVAAAVPAGCPSTRSDHHVRGRVIAVGLDACVVHCTLRIAAEFGMSDSDSVAMERVGVKAPMVPGSHGGRIVEMAGNFGSTHPRSCALGSSEPGPAAGGRSRS
jgi:hypothetical protein